MFRKKRVTAAYMATFRQVNTVTRAQTLVVVRVLTAIVATSAGLDTGHQRVTTRVVQGVNEAYVIRMTAGVHVDKATMEFVVIRNVLHTVLITHVLLLMGLARVFKDITVNVVNTRVWFSVKIASMMPSVQCVLSEDTAQPVLLTVNVTVVHVIS